MGRLIVLELQRILRRPVVRAAWLGMLVLFVLSGPLNLIMGHRTFTDDGKLVQGWQAVQLERQRAQPLNTVWTPEKVERWMEEVRALLAEPGSFALYPKNRSYDLSWLVRSIYYNNYFSLFEDLTWPKGMVPVLSEDAAARLEKYQMLALLLDQFALHDADSLFETLGREAFACEWNSGLAGFFEILGAQGMVLWMALLAALGTLGIFCSDRTCSCLDTLRASRCGQTKLALARMAAAGLYGAGCAAVWCGAALLGCMAVCGAGGWDTPAFTLPSPSAALLPDCTGGQLVLLVCGMVTLGCIGCAMAAALVSAVCRSGYGAFFLAAALAFLFLLFSSIGGMEGPVVTVRTVGMCNPLSLVIYQNTLYYAPGVGSWYLPAVCAIVAVECAACAAGAVALHCKRP